MIRKIICGVINTISVLVIAAAIVILCMVLFTEPGKPPNIFWLYNASYHDRKYGTNVCD